MKSIKKIIWKILNLLRIGPEIQINLDGYLIEKGWKKSFLKKKSIDAKDNPVPWLTYSFVYFIEKKLKPELNLFEFGSGNSTIWFSQRVNKVWSIECNLEWFDYVKNNMPKNAKLFYKDDNNGDEYESGTVEAEGKIDIVLIDGTKRMECLTKSLPNIKPDGVFIIDNMERENYQEIHDLLTSKNYKNIAFEGMAPGSHHTSITTVFYPEVNCLSI